MRTLDDTHVVLGKCAVELTTDNWVGSVSTNTYRDYLPSEEQLLISSAVNGGSGNLESAKSCVLCRSEDTRREVSLPSDWL